MSEPVWLTSSDGLRIAYDDEGTDTSRPPVVLHHGFSADGHLNWAVPGVVVGLVASGRRVVNLDARGHGRSDKPHDPACYGEPRMAVDVSTLIDALGVDEVDLVGYSMGAIVALIAAAQDQRVRRLVAGGVGAGVVERGGLDTRALDPQVVEAAMRASDTTTITDAVARQFRALADSIGADRLALAAHLASMHPLTIPLEQITSPTLVIAGRDDVLAVRPQVLAAVIPNAQVIAVDGDHFAAVFTPAFASSIVDFLNG